MAIRRKRLSSPKIIALGFFSVILLGALLLSLPAASQSGQSIGFINALFTATSATCVTGLVVIDTCLGWTLFGQLVILALIQIGGLGFMTVLTLFSLSLRRRIGLRQREVLQDSVNTTQLGGILRLIKRILIGTLCFELLGALILSLRFVPELGFWPGVYCGVFHAVSAFCNAGFDIMGRYGAFSSLMPYAADPVVIFTIAALIIIGGIGFLVWDDVAKHRFKLSKYRLHSKLALTVTAALLLFGTLMFWEFERNNTLSEMPLWQQLMNAFFSAVTPRTAGFNVVDNAALSPAGSMLTSALMFIGGSPGSTAGGIKTTTFAVFLIALISSLSDRSSSHVFGRRLQRNVFRRATAVLTFHLGLVVAASLCIGALHPDLRVGDIILETVSAISTVGSSAGLTPHLSAAAHIILMSLMYSGRVGSLTIMMAFKDSGRPAAVESPEEFISIG